MHDTLATYLGEKQMKKIHSKYKGSMHVDFLVTVFFPMILLKLYALWYVIAEA